MSYVPPHRRNKKKIDNSFSSSSGGNDSFSSNSSGNFQNSYKKKSAARKPTVGRPVGEFYDWGSECRAITRPALPDKLPQALRMQKEADKSTPKLSTSSGGWVPPHKRTKKYKPKNKASASPTPTEEVPVKNETQFTPPKNPASLTTSNKCTEEIDAIELVDSSDNKSTSSQESGLTSSVSEGDQPSIIAPVKEEESCINKDKNIAPELRIVNDCIETYVDENRWQEPYEWALLCTYFLDNSPQFKQLQDLKREGRSNEHVMKFFAAKTTNQDNSRSRKENTKGLFTRFYRYAVDIDLGVNYVEDIINRGGGTFLEFGFAPGGMSRLLLDASSNIRGIGVTLVPEEGGNVYPVDFDHHPRFQAFEYDVIELAALPDDKICNKLNMENLNSLVSLSIIGITVHQNFHEFDHLDHQILYSQLFLTLLFLEEGGSLLIRHKMGLSLIHTHLMVLLLEIFDGAEPVASKPVTEFVIRKTYWVLWRGFNREKMLANGLLEKVKKLLIDTVEGNKSGYDYNDAEKKYYNPIFIDKNVKQIIEVHGESLLKLQIPMWEVQAAALDSYFSGKKDKICSKRYKCRGINCTSAHCKSDLIPGVLEQMDKVDERIEKEKKNLESKLNAHYEKNGEQRPRQEGTHSFDNEYKDMEHSGSDFRNKTGPSRRRFFNSSHKKPTAQEKRDPTQVVPKRIKKQQTAQTSSSTKKSSAFQTDGW